MACRRFTEEVMADWVRVKVWKVDVEEHEEKLGIEPQGEPKAVPQWVNIAKAITFYENEEGNGEFDRECNIDFGNDLVISVQASENELVHALEHSSKFWRIH